MKNLITKAIIMIASVPTASIYLIRTLEISIPVFIIILLANVTIITTVGYQLKIQLENFYKEYFKNSKH